MDVIITGANKDHFDFLEVFVRSLRTKALYKGKIVVCDNTIGGKWDKPEAFVEVNSMTSEQMKFLSDHDVEVIAFHDLLKENNISRHSVDQIPSFTQRYPFKFIYTCLISKKYINTAKNICFFDADIYFQKPIQPLFSTFEADALYIVKEFTKIGNNAYLNKWISFSDFSNISDQEHFKQKMFASENFCSGFFGGKADVFHSFTLLCWLLTTNQLVKFYSDQPLVNILKSFFNYPIHELSNEYVLHLGELYKEDILVNGEEIFYNSKKSIAVHFNGGTKPIFEQIKHPLVKSSYQLFFETNLKNRYTKSTRNILNTLRYIKKMLTS